MSNGKKSSVSHTENGGFFPPENIMLQPSPPPPQGPRPDNLGVPGPSPSFYLATYSTWAVTTGPISNLI